MTKTRELEKYCKKMLLNFEVKGNVLTLGMKMYLIVDSEQILFNEEFEFLPLLTADDREYINGHVYQFCGHWYIQEYEEKTSMTPLKYIGEVKQRIKTNSFLGIHSGNELLNGVGLYEDWIKKAKFLKISSLGICEKNTVGGSMDFQKLCLKNNIKPIVGLSIEIKSKNDTYIVKCYCKDFEGWQNLLKFTYILNVQNESNISEEFLIQNKGGLHIIVDPKSSKFLDYSTVTEFYQLDTVVFEEENKDIEYANNLKNFITSKMKPIAIYDAYYLERDDYKVREKLWGISKLYDYRTKNQYFKNNDEYATELLLLFEKGNASWIKLFKEAEKNLNNLVETCNFIYDTTSRHLPLYEMTKEESETFSSNEQLFMHLIKKGFKDRNVKDAQKYVDRLKKEIEVLKNGDVIDYFLITRDIINEAKRADILVGLGRGSAGGCLVSYLLGIIQINPLELDLIFERFLNPGRMGALEECPAYLIETNKANIKLNEKSILKINRGKRELNIFIEDLIEGDEILKY